MDPQATCGRVVHYTVALGVTRCALVIADTPEDGTAALMVQLDSGPAPIFGVPYSESPGMVGSWNWMPYQREKAKTARGNVSESAVPTEADSPRDGADRDVETPAGSVGPEMVAPDDVEAATGEPVNPEGAAPADLRPFAEPE